MKTFYANKDTINITSISGSTGNYKLKNLPNATKLLGKIFSKIFCFNVSELV